MGTIAEKLENLTAIKSDLKAALAEKGQTVGEVFSTYPDAVRAIETGNKVAYINFTFLSSDESNLVTYLDSDGNLQKEASIYNLGNDVKTMNPSLMIFDSIDRVSARGNCSSFSLGQYTIVSVHGDTSITIGR